MRRISSVLLAAVLLLGFAAAAAEADVWSPARPISGTHARAPEVALTPDGAGIVAWTLRQPNVVPDASADYVGYATRAGAQSPFTAPHETGVAVGFPSVAAGDGGLFRMLWAERDGDSTSLVEAAGPLGARVDSSAAVGGRHGQTAIDGRGNALVLWSELPDEPAHRRPLYMAHKFAGGAFGAPRRLSDDGGASAVVALDSTGRGAVAWLERAETVARREVRVVSCDAGGCDGGRVVSDARLGGDAIKSLTVNRSGDAALVWTTGDGTYFPRTSVVASLRRRGQDFGAARTLKEGGDDPVVDVQGAALSDDRELLLLFWNGYRLQAIRAPDGKPPGPAAVVPGSVNGSYAVSAAYDSTGAGVVAWARDQDGMRKVQAAELLPAGLWVGPQTVSAIPSPPRYEPQEQPKLAFDGSGRGLIVWTVSPEQQVLVADYDGAAVEAPQVVAAATAVAPAGAKVSYTLDRAARVQIELRRTSLRTGECARSRRPARCALPRTLARKAFNGRRGRNKVLVKQSGRRRKLARGSYRVTLVAGSGRARSTKRVGLRVR